MSTKDLLITYKGVRTEEKNEKATSFFIVKSLGARAPSASPDCYFYA